MKTNYCTYCGKRLKKTKKIKSYHPETGKPKHYWECPDFQTAEILEVETYKKQRQEVKEYEHQDSRIINFFKFLKYNDYVKTEIEYNAHTRIAK